MKDKLEIKLKSTCSRDALVDLMEVSLQTVKASEAKRLKITMEINQLE